MRRLITLLQRELSAFYYSPIAYIVLFFFLVLNEVGTSHGSLLPIPSGNFSEWDILA